MADIYQKQGGDIGTLLRLIQEEKSTGILNQPPANDPSSPIRQTVQGPLLSPEAPGGARVASIRPEGLGQLAPETSQVVAPGGATVQAGRVVSPVRPVPTPVPTPTPPSAPSAAPSSPAPSRPAPGPSFPTIATKITGGLIRSVLGTQAPASKTVPRTRFGGQIVRPDPKANPSRPNPTPTPVKNNPKGRPSGHISYLA